MRVNSVHKLYHKIALGSEKMIMINEKVKELIQPENFIFVVPVITIILSLVLLFYMRGYNAWSNPQLFFLVLVVTGVLYIQTVRIIKKTYFIKN